MLWGSLKGTARLSMTEVTLPLSSACSLSYGAFSAFWFLMLDGGLLVLAVIVADCHSEEKAVHPTAALSAQYLQSLEELTEVFIHAGVSLHRVEKEIFEPGDRETQGGEAEFVGKGIPFNEG